MAKEKAAVFVDNSNIFKGTQQFSTHLRKSGRLPENRYLSIRWDNLLDILEGQNGGIDVFARHFFASLPPAADVSKLTKRPTEDEWNTLVKQSAQTGFYKAIQGPPCNFVLHGIPLRFADVLCRNKTKQAYYRCRDSQGGVIKCKLSLDLDQCYSCDRKFLFKYEKGVDVALAVALTIFSGVGQTALDRVILVAGDGDYKEAVRQVRQQVGRDVQIVSWRKPLSKELEQLSNKPPLILDEFWEQVCDIRSKAPLEEMPGVPEEGED